MEFKYNTVEEAIEAFKQGKMVLVTDDIYFCKRNRNHVIPEKMRCLSCP